MALWIPAWKAEQALRWDQDVSLAWAALVSARSDALRRAPPTWSLRLALPGRATLQPTNESARSFIAEDEDREVPLADLLHAAAPSSAPPPPSAAASSSAAAAAAPSMAHVAVTAADGGGKTTLLRFLEQRALDALDEARALGAASASTAPARALLPLFVDAAAVALLLAAAGPHSSASSPLVSVAAALAGAPALDVLAFVSVLGDELASPDVRAQLRSPAAVAALVLAVLLDAPPAKPAEISDAVTPRSHAAVTAVGVVADEDVFAGGAAAADERWAGSAECVARLRDKFAARVALLRLVTAASAADEPALLLLLDHVEQLPFATARSLLAGIVGAGDTDAAATPGGGRSLIGLVVNALRAARVGRAVVACRMHFLNRIVAADAADVALALRNAPVTAASSVPLVPPCPWTVLRVLPVDALEGVFPLLRTCALRFLPPAEVNALSELAVGVFPTTPAFSPRLIPVMASLLDPTNASARSALEVRSVVVAAEHYERAHCRRAAASTVFGGGGGGGSVLRFARLLALALMSSSGAVDISAALDIVGPLVPEVDGRGVLLALHGALWHGAAAAAAAPGARLEWLHPILPQTLVASLLFDAVLGGQSDAVAEQVYTSARCAAGASSSTGLRSVFVEPSFVHSEWWHMVFVYVACQTSFERMFPLLFSDTAPSLSAWLDQMLLVARTMDDFGQVMFSVVLRIAAASRSIEPDSRAAIGRVYLRLGDLSDAGNLHLERYPVHGFTDHFFDAADERAVVDRFIVMLQGPTWMYALTLLVGMRSASAKARAADAARQLLRGDLARTRKAALRLLYKLEIRAKAAAGQLPSFSVVLPSLLDPDATVVQEAVLACISIFHLCFAALAPAHQRRLLCADTSEWGDAPAGTTAALRWEPVARSAVSALQSPDIRNSSSLCLQAADSGTRVITAYILAELERGEKDDERDTPRVAGASALHVRDKEACCELLIHLATEYSRKSSTLEPELASLVEETQPNQLLTLAFKLAVCLLTGPESARSVDVEVLLVYISSAVDPSFLRKLADVLYEGLSETSRVEVLQRLLEEHSRDAVLMEQVVRVARMLPQTFVCASPRALARFHRALRAAAESAPEQMWAWDLCRSVPLHWRTWRGTGRLLRSTRLSPSQLAPLLDHLAAVAGELATATGILGGKLHLCCEAAEAVRFLADAMVVLTRFHSHERLLAASLGATAAFARVLRGLLVLDLPHIDGATHALSISHQLGFLCVDILLQARLPAVSVQRCRCWRSCCRCPRWML